MRLTQLVTAITAALHSLAQRIEGIAHGLHGSALHGHYVTVSREAATLRTDLTNLTANTRDLTIGAKVAYAKALDDAKVAFEAEIAKISHTHGNVRAITVQKLDAVNTAARGAIDAIEAHHSV